MKKMTRFTLTALFVALILLLGFTPLGLIPLGFIYVTILCLPVIIGTLLLGLRTGLLLGFVFGCVSTYKLFTAPSTLSGNLLGASPFLAVVMCILPRLLIPLAAHVVYHRVAASGKERFAAVAAGAAGSLTNTVFYLGLMLLFYKLAGLDSAGVIALIIGTGVIAGGSEALVSALLVPPIYIAVKKTIKTP